MPKARYQQISLSDTPYYHCISRCVRRAFLCGQDTFSGKNYEHRKTWISERLSQLSKIFSIDIYAYAIMDNHLHTVLCVRPDKAEQWNESHIVERWSQLFKIPILIERYIYGQCHSDAEILKAQEIIETWKSRLMDISWFMRCLNEYIARKANAEDSCTGRFWEGRFKTQALLNEQALLACMVYVDLNPVRAGISDSLHKSEHTSIKQRIDSLTQKQPEKTIPLAPFIASSQKKSGIPFDLKDYIELTDWTGRIARNDKKGSITPSTPKILEQLKLDEQTWNNTVHGFSSQFYSVIGAENQIEKFCKKHGNQWIKGINYCRKLFKNKLCLIPVKNY